jgi:hypothetical protein
MDSRLFVELESKLVRKYLVKKSDANQNIHSYFAIFGGLKTHNLLY